MANNNDKSKIDNKSFKPEDMEFDFDFDLSTPHPKSKGGVVTDFKGGFMSSLKSSFKDENLIRKLIKNALPESYSIAVDTVYDSTLTIKEITKDLSTKTQDGINELKKSVNSVLPRYSGRLPQNILDRVTKWSSQKDPEDSGKSLDEYKKEAQENEIASTLNDIFVNQAELSQAQHVESVTSLQAIAVKQDKRLLENARIMIAMQKDIARMSSYNDRVDAAYKRKSLELQLRSYKLQEASTRTTLDFYRLVKERLEGIVTNTSIADIYKPAPIKKTNIFSRYAGGGIKSTIGNMVAGMSKEHIARANLGLFGLSNAIRAVGNRGMSASHMGGIGAGALVGMAIPDIIGMMIPSMMGGGKHAAMGHDLSYYLSNAGGMLNRHLKNRTRLDEGWDPSKQGGLYNYLRRTLVNPSINNLLDRIPIQRGNKTQYRTMSMKELTQPAVFDNLSRKSLVEIIPGLLTRINTGIEKLRTGRDDVEHTVYNLHKGKFTTSSENAKTLKSSLFNSGQFGSTSSYMNSIMDEIDPDKKLSPAVRKSLMIRMLKDRDAGDAFNLKSLVKGNYGDNLSSSQRLQMSAFLRNRFRGHEGSRLRNRVSSSLSHLQLPDIQGNLDTLLATGNISHLKSLGLIKVVNGKEEFNHDAYWEAMGEHLDTPTAIGNRKSNITFKAKEALASSSINKHMSSMSDNVRVKKKIANEFIKEFGNNKDILNIINNSGVKETPNELLRKLKNKVTSLKLPSMKLKRPSLTHLKDRLKSNDTSISNEEIESIIEASEKGDKESTSWLKSHAHLLKKLGYIGASISTFGLPQAWKATTSKYSIPGAIRHITSMTKSTVKTIGGKLASIKEDLYVSGTNKPLLRFNRMKAGEYFDEASGHVITSYEDIKSSVVDKVGNLIASKEELEQDLYTSSGEKVDLDVKKDNSSDIVSTITKSSKLKYVKWMKNFMPKGAMDVYTKDSETPALTAKGMKDGRYFDSKTHKAVTRFKDIKNPVIDENGDVVLSADDLRSGLYDKTGKKIRDWSKAAYIGLNIATYGLPMAWKATAKNKYSIPGMVKNVYNKVNPAKQYLTFAEVQAKKEQNDINKATADIDDGKPIVDNNGKLKAKNLTATDNILLRMYGAIKGEDSGHHIRRNSWMDMFSRKGNKKEDEHVDHTDDKAKDDKKPKSLFGLLGSMASSVIGGIKKIKKLGILGALSEFLSLGWIGKLVKGITAPITWLAKLLLRRGGGGSNAGDFLTKEGKKVPKGKGGFFRRMFSKVKGSRFKVPKLGGALAAASLAMDGYNLYEDHKSGDNRAVSGDVGSMAGTGLGGWIGGAIGSLILPGVGTGIGFMAGSYLGSKFGEKIAISGYDKFSKGLNPNNLNDIQKLRMTQYGLRSFIPDDVKVIFQLETTLDPHVQITSDGYAGLDPKVNPAKLMAMFNIDPSDREHVQNWSVWFTQRFKPVYLTHRAKAKTLFKLDTCLNNSTKPTANQQLNYARQVTQFDDTNEHPYRYSPEIFPDINTLTYSETMSITNAIIQKLTNDAKKSPQGMESSTIITKVTPQKMLTTKVDSNIAAAIGNNIPGVNVKGHQETGFFGSTSTVVSTQDILGNILPSKGDKLDDLTSYRLKTYGMGELEYTRVCTVLELELAALNDVTYSNGTATYKGNADKLFHTFRMAFGHGYLVSVYKSDWINWFNKRFLPVFLEFCARVNNIQASKNPLVTAKTLKPSDQYSIALAISKIQVDNGKGQKVSVWTINYPMFNTVAPNTDPSSVALILQTMQYKAQKDTSSNMEKVYGANGKASDISKDKSYYKDKVTGLYLKRTMVNKDDLKYGSNLSRTTLNTSTGNVDKAYGGDSGVSNITNPGGVGANGLPGDITSTGGAPVKPPKLGPGEQIGRLQAIKAAQKFGITDKKELAMFLAQVHHESGGFNHVEENLNYRPNTLQRVWPNRFPNSAVAQQVASKGKVAIANVVYGDRMGNKDPGDGFKYRGRGFMQITGKDNYRAVAKGAGIDVLQNPDWLTTPEGAASSAAYYWTGIANGGIRNAAKQGDVSTVTKLVNGGLNGLSDRQGLYAYYSNMINNGELDSLMKQAGMMKDDKGSSASSDSTSADQMIADKAKTAALNSAKQNGPVQAATPSGNKFANTSKPSTATASTPSTTKQVAKTPVYSPPTPRPSGVAPQTSQVVKHEVHAHMDTSKGDGHLENMDGSIAQLINVTTQQLKVLTDISKTLTKGTSVKSGSLSTGIDLGKSHI